MHILLTNHIVSLVYMDHVSFPTCFYILGAMVVLSIDAWTLLSSCIDIIVFH